jgi:hypothetical protein
MSKLKAFASFVLAATFVPALFAEAHCPGHVASLPFTLTNHGLIVVEVSVDHSGPYNFLLDTGDQITILDSALAVELQLETQDTARSVGVGLHVDAAVAHPGLLGVGSHAATIPMALVFDLHNRQSGDVPIRGILGEDFLGQFDLLIDNAHHFVCLDDKAAMRADVKGTHVAVTTPAQIENGLRLPSLLIVAVRLSGGASPVRLQLDSGANGSVLFNTPRYMVQFSHASLRGQTADGTQQTFSVLPPQSVRVGSLELREVSFVSLPDAQNGSHSKEFDGVLTTALFRRVFIDHANSSVVLEAW